MERTEKRAARRLLARMKRLEAEGPSEAAEAARDEAQRLLLTLYLERLQAGKP